MTTVADIQKKITNKLEQKSKRALNQQVLFKAFADEDKNGDGFVTVTEFKRALELNGNPLKQDEAEFVFMFWDTMAGQQEPQGAVEVSLIAADLWNQMPQYSTGFNSGAESIKANKGGQSNKSSVAGGIFGGGSYEADANRDMAVPSPSRDRRPPTTFASQPVAPAAPSGRPRGNQSSIPGGIFGGEEAMAAAAPPPSSRASANKSNQSSIPGGIFGDGQAAAPPARMGRNSNQSSIPGGIFG